MGKEGKKERAVHGKHPVLEAIASGTSIDRILVRKKGGVGVDEVLAAAREKGIPCQKVPSVKLDKLVKGKHQGVIALTAPIPFADPETLLSGAFESGKEPLFLVLDGVTDVRNFGAICRTAECCGVGAVFIPMKGGASVNEDAVRTSAGALMRLTVARFKEVKELPSLFASYGISSVACTEKAEGVLSGIDLKGPLALFVGDEEKGLSRPLLERVATKGRLPMLGGIASLNVSVATGMMLYEVVRQRDPEGLPS